MASEKRLFFYILLATEKEHKVGTLVISVDFSRQDVYPQICNALDGLEIGILGE